MKNLFNIYHPLGGFINYRCERGIHEYEQVATVDATSLQEAFTQAQNDFNPEYEELGHRSTCVGDIITQSDEFGNVEHYIVESFGFVEVPPTVLGYIDWSLHSVINEYIAEQMLENPEDYGLI
jgi:hypothetical protein